MLNIILSFSPTMLSVFLGCHRQFHTVWNNVASLTSTDFSALSSSIQVFIYPYIQPKKKSIVFIFCLASHAIYHRLSLYPNGCICMYILRFNTHSKERDPSIFALFLLYLLNLLPRRRFFLSSDGGCLISKVSPPPISYHVARRTDGMTIPEFTLTNKVSTL